MRATDASLTAANVPPMTFTRRDLFKRSAAAGAGLVVAGNLDVLFNATNAGATPAAGAGPLVADPSGILDLPRGFSCSASPGSTSRWPCAW